MADETENQQTGKQVKIDPKLIDSFESSADHTASAGPESDHINFDGLTQTIQFSLENINTFLKGQGLPGWNERDTPSYTKLAVVIAKRNVKAEWLKNSPEFLGVAILGTIAAENILALKKIKAGFNGQDKPAADD